MPYAVDVQVDPAVAPDLAKLAGGDCAGGDCAEWLAEVARAVLAHAGQPPDTELSLLVTTDEQMQELNRAFRGVDAPTDVLSFSAREGEGFIVPAEVVPYLGDVVISLPTVRRQAAEAGHSVREELALLVVHGCLHLLGYDHGTPEEKASMWTLQDDLLRRLGASPSGEA